MTRISNSEQVLALVRAQLQRMAKRERSDPTAKLRGDTQDAGALSSRGMVEALNAIEGLSDEDFVRGFVRALLTEELGEQVANSPDFLSIVDRTAEAMRSDAEARALLARLRQGN